MRRLNAHFGEAVLEGVHRVIDLGDLAAEWQPSLRFLLIGGREDIAARLDGLRASGLSNVSWIDAEGLQRGDVVVSAGNGKELMVLDRASDHHHGLQLTNRCNSYCLMCSQPPTAQDDEWMVQEAVDVLRHMSPSAVIGLSGGEPLLLGDRLREILETVKHYHPAAKVDLLTNGRLLADREFADSLLSDLETPTSWLVPLYGHADFLHDFIVQAKGAFEQTLQGILNLQAYRQPVQLRVVLIQPVLEELEELCIYIGRNLPFVREVALMACEPIGFALANRDVCEVDLSEWHETLHASCRILARHEVPFLFMNAPLCALPEQLRPYAHRSISDWKNVYAPVCSECSLRASCSGFFSWHERGWKPLKTIKIFEEEKA